MWWEIQPNHANDGPAALVSVDTETQSRTDPANPRRRLLSFRLGVARYVRIEADKEGRRAMLEFDQVEDFWRWLEGNFEARRPVWLWCHNAGFDLTILRLWERIAEGEYAFSGPAPGPSGKTGKARRPWHGLCIIDDPPTALILRHRSGAILHVCDTFNWFPRSLASLGPDVGLPQLPPPGDAAEVADWWARCRVDAEIVERVAIGIGRWVRRWRAGRHRYTVAGQAMALYRHRCLPAEGRLDWGHDLGIKRAERLAYYGALRQCLFRGVVVPAGQGAFAVAQMGCQGGPVIEGGPVHHLDLTAAYGAAMIAGDYPTKYLRRYKDESVKSALAMLQEVVGCAYVSLNDRRSAWPVRRGKDVWWVTGRVDAWLCGPELVRALQSGAVERVRVLLAYRAGRPFDEYVSACWEARTAAIAAGQPLWAGLAKGVMAALHGRLSARLHRWETLRGVSAPVVWGHYHWDRGPEGGTVERRCLGDVVQERQAPDESRTGFALLGAFVAAYCRERMRGLLAIAGSLNTYYVDTDTLHVSPEGLSLLVAAGEVADGQLGKLHRVATYQCVQYLGPLDYVADGEVVLSGLSARAVPAGPNCYWAEDFSRLPNATAHGPPGEVTVTEKLLSRPHHPIRGKVGSDGWVEPFDASDLVK